MKLSDDEGKVGMIILLISLWLYFKTGAIVAILFIVIVGSLFISRHQIYEQLPRVKLWYNMNMKKPQPPKVPELGVVLGQNTVLDAEYFVLNLHQVNHMMIVAMTQFGKSTLVETLLYQIVRRYNKSQIQIAICDPSQSQGFRIFHNIPHLFMPIARKGEVLTFLEKIEQEMESRGALYARIPENHKVDSVEDFERACKILGYDYEAPKPLVVILDEMHHAIELKGVKKLVDNIHKTGAKFNIKFIGVSNRPTSDSLSTAAKSQISTKFVGHLAGAKEYSLAEVDKDVYKGAISEKGHFITFKNGRWGYFKSAKIDPDVLRNYLDSIRQPIRESDSQTNIIISDKRDYRGSTSDKEQMVMAWLMGKNFETKPTPEVIMQDFNIRSLATARKAIDTSWDDYLLLSGRKQ